MERKYQPAITCQFALNTDVDTFARRIAYLTRTIYLDHFPTQDGFITLHTADIHYSDQLDCPHVIYISGRHYILREGAPIAEDPSNLVPMISFQLSPLPTRPQSIDVIATCSEPAVESCFKYLLKDIWENCEEAREGIELCWPEAYEERRATVAELAAEIRMMIGDVRAHISRSVGAKAHTRKTGGRPGLDPDELVYRLAKAQQAREIRKRDPSMTWKEIAKEIEWNKGTDDAGLATLRNARHRLRRLEPGDPLLEQVAQYRAKETKKM